MPFPFCFSTDQGGKLRIRPITVECGKDEGWEAAEAWPSDPNGTALEESTTIKQKCKHTLGTSSLESSLGDTLAASLFRTPWVMENAFHKVQAEHHTGFPTNYQPVNSLQGGSGSRAMRMD